VAKVRYTRRAEADLDDIAEYTIETWNVEQCARYIGDLETCCQRLADNPMLGRVYALRPRYWRYEQGRHVVFFRREAGGDMLVVRVLHQSQLPELHLDEAEDE
jgi:toxin ParE1/3/4